MLSSSFEMVLTTMWWNPICVEFVTCSAGQQQGRFGTNNNITTHQFAIKSKVFCQIKPFPTASFIQNSTNSFIIQFIIEEGGQQKRK